MGLAKTGLQTPVWPQARDRTMAETRSRRFITSGIGLSSPGPREAACRSPGAMAALAVLARSSFHPAAHTRRPECISSL